MDLIYIASVDRSGSTILGKVLGQNEDTEYIGESIHFADQAKHGGKCGCEKGIKECDRWANILKRIDNKSMSSCLASIRTRELFYSSPEVDPDVTKSLRTFYESIDNEWNSSVIIDSSSHPSYLYTLEKAIDGKINILHLVRDPRAVIYSWWRRPLHEGKKNKKFIKRSRSTFKYENPIRASLIWSSWNYLIDNRWSGGNYHCMRYEDFCENPKEQVSIALEVFGIEDKIEWELGNTIHISKNHTIKGNPNRFESGNVKIENNKSWFREMGGIEKFLVTLSTYPMSKKYGYI